MISEVFGRANVRIVDITANPDLEDVYVFRIPVLLFEDRVLAEGVIDRRTAREALGRARAVARSGSHPL